MMLPSVAALHSCFKASIILLYVNDMFAFFDHKAEAAEFPTTRNCFHPFLKLTFEKDICLAFLHVYVEIKDIAFETSVYRKLTFTS